MKPKPTPIEHHPTSNLLNLQTANITSNTQTQTIHVKPYTHLPYASDTNHESREPL